GAPPPIPASSGRFPAAQGLPQAEHQGYAENPSRCPRIPEGESDMTWESDESFARHLDEADPLRHTRELFYLPHQDDGSPLTYFCGHSLGLQPKAVRGLIEQELDDWARLGVEGHFHGKTPWYSYHEVFRETGARLVGARPGEVVMMNSLTVNLHLMLATFYRP